MDDIVKHEPTPVARGPIALALQQVTELLTPGESLQAVAIQRQYVYLAERSRRKIVAATPARLIVMHRHVFGGFDVFDVRWQDLEAAQISEGTFGATLTFTVRDTDHAMLVKDMAGGGTLRVAGLRKAAAQEVYRVCQSQERSWREKNRVREMEELRAKAGGIQFGASPGTTGGSNTAEPDALSRLERASEMLKKGLISDSEYESVKAKILSAL
jgi:hypothetical protein